MSVEDRAEINKRLAIGNYFPPFFSALIAALGRPDYELECVNNIIKNADMPVEIIVHDDGSDESKQRVQFDTLRDKVSTMIYNFGFNTGLARSMNRCRAMASSKYLIGFNSDVYVTSSFLKAMKEALDIPYVGLVNVSSGFGDGKGIHVTPRGHKVRLLNGTGNCHCFGIRKDVWDEVGGWDENVQTTASDVGFVGTLLGHGYFAVQVEGTITNEMWPKSEDGRINTEGSNPDYVECGQFCRNDNNVPRIFNYSEKEHEHKSEKRREDIWHGVNDAQNADTLYPQWYNGKFQADQISKLFRNGNIDWEFAKTYGHDKWKDQIIKDFNLEEK